MPQKKDLRERTLSSQFTSPEWILHCRICDILGWKFSPIVGWLLLVQEHGLTKSQLISVSNLPHNEFALLWDELLESNLIEQVKYPRQYNKTGVRLAFAELELLFPTPTANLRLRRPAKPR